MARSDIHWRLPSPYIIAPNRDAQIGEATNTIAVNTWPAANRAIYLPVKLPATVQLASVSFWCTVTGSANYDLGIYDSTCTNRLASKGSTALSAGAINTWTLTTPMLLEAGVRYYVGIVMSSATTSTLRGTPTVKAMRQAGCSQQATAIPLPATATPAQVATANWPIVALGFL